MMPLRKNRGALTKLGRLKPGLQRCGPLRKNRGALTKNAHDPWRGKMRPGRRKTMRCCTPCIALSARRSRALFGPKARPFAQPARTRGKRARKRWALIVTLPNASSV